MSAKVISMAEERARRTPTAPQDPETIIVGVMVSKCGKRQEWASLMVRLPHGGMSTCYSFSHPLRDWANAVHRSPWRKRHLLPDGTWLMDANSMEGIIGRAFATQPPSVEFIAEDYIGGW